LLNIEALNKNKCQRSKSLYTMSTQFVTDNDGNKLAVILPIKEYNKMVEDLEELDDIKRYDAAKKGEQEFIVAEEAFKEIEEKREGKRK